jgi:hypothetical protein
MESGAATQPETVTPGTGQAGEPSGAGAPAAKTTIQSRRRPTPISTKLHGVLDYTTGATLIAAPALFGLQGTRAGRILRGFGINHIAYSALTAYELGLGKIPMRQHLASDALGAVAMAASPLALRTASEGRRHWLPHVLFGVYELTAVALSDTHTGGD